MEIHSEELSQQGESRIILNQNSGYGCKLYVTQSMQEIANKIDQLYLDNKIEFSVGLVPAGYYAKPEECKLGDFGWIGSHELIRDGIDYRENFDEKNETLKLNIQIKNTKDIDEIKLMLEGLYITQGNNWRKHEILKITPNNVYDKITTKYYLCKKEGFDKVLEVMQKYNNHITYKELMRTEIGRIKYNKFNDTMYNADLLELTDIFPPNPTDVIETYEDIQNEIIGVESYDIVIEIIATDLERNKEMLYKIIKFLLE